MMTHASARQNDGNTTLGTVLADSEGDRVRWRLPRTLEEFVMVPQITRGLGSSAIHLDRGQPGSLRHIAVTRTASAVVLEQKNTHFIASQERNESVLDSFGRSMVAYLPIVESDADSVTVDVSELMVSDLVGIKKWLGISGVTGAGIDASRSRVLPAESYAHADGIELSADVTIAGLSGPAAAEVLPDETTLVITQRLTFVPLPALPFEARRYQVASGGYGKRFQDYSLAPDASWASGWQPRFRASAENPVVFQVDSNVPSPWREDLVEGGNYWQAAFERAGLPGAYRVEAAAPGTDLARAGSNPVWWVHRAGRGWSMGAALTDPRTGEILKGNVRLGSQRVQQLTLIGEALLSPYGRPDEAERLAQIREMVRARIRVLAAHEIGHAIGFMHNYSITGHETPSVMDYPNMRMRLDENGEIVLSDGYATGASEWDMLTVSMSYGTEEVAQAAAERARELGIKYATDMDGHGPWSSIPDAIPWVIHESADAGLAQVLAVREKALADFGRGAAPRDAQSGELEKRYAIVHMLHRFQANGVARHLGGVFYEYGTADNPETAPVPVAPEVQHEALKALAAAIQPDIVRVPDHVVEMLPAPSIRFERSTSDFATFTEPVFDPLSAAAAAVRCVVEPAFEPNRVNRAQIAHDAAGAPSPVEILDAFLAVAPDLGDTLQQEIRKVVLVLAITAVRSGTLHAAPERALRARLTEVLGAGDEALSAALASAAAPIPEIAPMPDGQPI